MLSLSGVTFAAFCFFRLNLYSLVEAAALRSQSFFHMHAPRQQHVVMYLETIRVLFFGSLGMPLFSNCLVPLLFSLYVESTSYVFFFPVVLSTCDNGLEFLHQHIM